MFDDRFQKKDVQYQWYQGNLGLTNSLGDSMLASP